jgi:hypothetical protein
VVGFTKVTFPAVADMGVVQQREEKLLTHVSMETGRTLEVIFITE